MMTGSTGNTKEADADIQHMVESVRSQLEEKTNKKYGMFKAISYKSQVVAGTNYFVKVQVGEGDHVHLRIFKPLPQTQRLPELSHYQESKSHHDSIEYF